MNSPPPAGMGLPSAAPLWVSCSGPVVLFLMMAPAVFVEQAEPFVPAALNTLGTKWGRPVEV